MWTFCWVDQVELVLRTLLFSLRRLQLRLRLLEALLEAKGVRLGIRTYRPSQ